MNPNQVHTFQGLAEICTSCKHKKAEHVCECCTDTSGAVALMYGNMLMCAACIDKEKNLQKEHNSEVKQQERLNTMMTRARDINQSVQIKTDLFNADTVALVELKAAIEADENIKDKQYAYADEIFNQITHLSDVIFGQREELLKNENKKRMLQINLQQVVGQLSAEIREKFKQADLNYQPQPPKIVKPKGEKAPSPKKFQKEEVRKFAAQYGANEVIVQMLVVAKNISPERAAIHSSNMDKGAKCELDKCPICAAVAKKAV